MTEDLFFERLRKHYEQNLPFIAYRKPEATGVQAFLQQNADLYTTEDFTESGFIFAPFDDRKKTILIPENASEKLIFEQVFSEEASTSVDSPKEEISEEKKSAHIQLVSKAVLALKTGEMDKVVLSRKEDVKLKEKAPLKLFRELLKTYPTAFVYCWFHPKVGCWLGATPETLFKVEGTRFKTMALAGTQKYTGTMEVTWGGKEKQEQQFVTDSIVENLKQSGVENLKISAPYTVRAGNLLHLRTDITGIMHSKAVRSDGSTEGISGIISVLHPTPAVCGLPKEKAKEFILSEEGYDREFYTGFLGELNLQKNTQRSRNRRNVENLAYRAVKKETALFVNLRCMKIEAEKAELFIGGGITKDSVPEDEWQETVNKAETMKKVLLKL
ncbi:chorismate-binding protein [Salinimicrobium flavum]|uniref:Chorismate-binding protein n=1 Tax=Salinimicrobium flavum TaxID=1737065 RepID=A0ABW5IYB6_9FLAO